MKKIINLILFFALFVGFSSAYTIGDVSVSFCNSNTGANDSSLNFLIKSGIPYEFCVNFSNSSKEDVPLSLGFVDGQLTNGESHSKACSNQGRLFAPYVNFSGKSSFVLNSLSSIQKKGTILFPAGYSGEVNGCLVYMISDSKEKVKKGGSMFNVIVRKANFMDGYVVGEFKRNLSLLSGNISYSIDKNDNSMVVNIPFITSSIVPESIQLTGVIKNSLGYERTILVSKLISGDAYLSFVFPDVPFYKGRYVFSFEGFSVLDKNLDLSYLSLSNKEPLIFSYEKVLFVVPWKLLFWAILIIVALSVLRKIIKKIFRKKA